MSLEDYLVQGSCWVCRTLSADILKELHDTRQRLPKGTVGASAVSRWLIAEHGFSEEQIDRAAINNHFAREHDKR